MMKKTVLLTAILMTLSACVATNQIANNQTNTAHSQNNAADRDTLTRQLCATEHKNINTIQHLIKQGADVNFSCPYDKDEYRTKLHSAAKNGSIELVKLLIENGANVNARDKYGETPLHHSIYHSVLDETQSNNNVSKEEIVKLLIENGADVNAKNNNEKTPLHYAESVTIAKLLINNGANINAKSKYGRNVLDYAQSQGNSDMVKMLTELGLQHSDKFKQDKQKEQMQQKCSYLFQSKEPPKQIEIPSTCNNFSITIENSNDKKNFVFVIATTREHAGSIFKFSNMHGGITGLNSYVKYEMKKNDNYIGIINLVDNKRANIQFEVNKIKSGNYVLYRVYQVEAQNKPPLLMADIKDYTKLIVK